MHFWGGISYSNYLNLQWIAFVEPLRWFSIFLLIFKKKKLVVSYIAKEIVGTPSPLNLLLCSHYVQ